MYNRAIRKEMIMPMNKQPKQRKTYTAEFKQQIVDLYNNGKRKSDIIREYTLSPSMLDRWISQANGSGSFKEKDNRSVQEQELMELRKQNAHLKMENDILYPKGHLKQAALILGRK